MTLRPFIRAAEVRVPVGTAVVTVPPATAAQWLWTLSEGTLTDIIPGMLSGDDRAVLAALMVAGRLTVDDLAEAARTAIGEAAGRPWWTVVRLVAFAGQRGGELYAVMLLDGIDPERLTLPAWCACIIAMVRRSADEKDYNAFQTDLMMPPAGTDPATAAALFDGVDWG